MTLSALVARVPTNGVRDVLPFLAAMWLGEALWRTLAAGAKVVSIPADAARFDRAAFHATLDAKALAFFSANLR